MFFGPEQFRSRYRRHFAQAAQVCPQPLYRGRTIKGGIGFTPCNLRGKL